MSQGDSTTKEGGEDLLAEFPSLNKDLLRRCRGQGPHLAKTGEPRGVSRVVAGFSSFEGEYSLPHVLGQGSPIFHSSFKGELGIALESLQGKIDLI